MEANIPGSQRFFELVEKRRKELEAMTPMQRAQDRVDAHNRGHGSLEGYNCRKCLNRGTIAYVTTRYGKDNPQPAYRSCDCLEIRASIQRLKASGLEKAIQEQTFKTFQAREEWQKQMLSKAEQYAKLGANEGRWFFIGGQPGCGKTHICTAIARELLYRMPVLYVIWEGVSKQLKAVINDAETYADQIDKLKTVKALYIDDLFKPVRDDTGRIVPPSAADRKLAFEILNYRYVNRLPTILSSEWHSGELEDIDEATGSRIFERCNKTEYAIDIARDRAKNQRIK